MRRAVDDEELRLQALLRLDADCAPSLVATWLLKVVHSSVPGSVNGSGRASCATLPESGRQEVLALA